MRKYEMRAAQVRFQVAALSAQRLSRLRERKGPVAAKR